MISLTNNSPHLNSDGVGTFQWDIEGATIISDPSAQDAITFVYGEDQEDVSWSLIYTEMVVLLLIQKYIM